MSQKRSSVDYPLSALKSFYKVASNYQTRLDLLLKDYYTETVQYSEVQKSAIHDAYLAARAIVRAVDGGKYLEQTPSDSGTVQIDTTTATVLSELLMTLGSYQTELVNNNIIIELQ